MFCCIIYLYGESTYSVWRNDMKKKLSVIIIFSIASAAFLYCGKVSGFLPNKVLKAYYNAQITRDWGTIYDLLSSEFRSKVETMINSPRGREELKALKMNNNSLNLSTPRDKFSAFMKTSSTIADTEFISYEIIEIPRIKDSQKMIQSKVREIRKIHGRKVIINAVITLKLEKDGWKIHDRSRP